MIKHDIKTKHLKAHIVAKILGVNVGHWSTESWVASYDSFDEEVIYPLLQLLNIVPVLANSPVDRSERPFMSNIHILNILVEDKVRTFLVNCVVGKMHKFIVQILRSRGFVLLGGKSCQTLFVNKYS